MKYQRDIEANPAILLKPDDPLDGRHWTERIGKGEINEDKSGSVD
jgi:hypothetical protein